MFPTHGITLPPVAKPNYSFEKRRRDIAKKAKKEEKRLRKLEAKNTPADPNAPAEEGEGAEPPPAEPTE